MKLGGQRRTGWHQSANAGRAGTSQDQQKGEGAERAGTSSAEDLRAYRRPLGPTQGLHMGNPRRREAQIGRASGGRVCGENRLNQLQGAGSAGRWHQSHGRT